MMSDISDCIRYELSQIKVLACKWAQAQPEAGGIAQGHHAKQEF